MSDIISWLTSLTLNKLLPSIVTLVIGLLVIKAVLKLFDRAMEKSKLEKAAATLIRSLLRVVLYILLALMVASGLGIDVSGLLALTSVVSLVVSLSLQEALSNVVGGFTLLSTHPFKAGDYVEVAGQAGVVQSIDITYTTLMTPDNKTISIPNSSVVSSQVVNYSTAPNRRVDITVSASYDSDVETVKEALLAAANIPQVLADPAPFTAVTKYGDNAIEYTLRLWSSAADYWDVFFTVTENIKTEFDNAGVKMTYPHLNVHLDK